MIILNPIPLTTVNPVPGNSNYQNLAALLDSIYKSTTLSSSGPLFFLQETQYDNNLGNDFVAAAGQAMAFYGLSPANQIVDYIWDRFAQPSGPKNAAALKIQYQNNLNASAVFKGVQNLHQVFVHLDKFDQVSDNCYLPFQTASFLSTAFIGGLVTRLLFDSYNNAWQRIAGTTKPPNLTLSFVPPGSGKPVSVDTWIGETLVNFSTYLLVSKNWDQWAALPSNNPYASSDFTDCLNYMTDATVQVAGFMAGWRAGDAMVANFYPANALTAAQCSATGLVTATTSSAHNVNVGDYFTISGCESGAPPAPPPPPAQAPPYNMSQFNGVFVALPGTGGTTLNYQVQNVQYAIAGPAAVLGQLARGSSDNSSVWGLLRSKYSIYHLGEVVGYALMYLSGFLKNERTIAIIKGSTSSTAPKQITGVANVGQIYDNLQQHGKTVRGLVKTKDAVFTLPQQFYELVAGELNAIAAKPITAFYTQTMQTTALKCYGDFINGLFQGTGAGADAMFTEIFEQAFTAGYDTGYTTGYSTGFRDGYSQGYATGYQAGYDSGFTSGYADGQDAWQQLTAITSNVAGALQSASSILGDVATVGTVVAAIF